MKRKRIIACAGLLVMASWFGWIRNVENFILDWYEGSIPLINLGMEG